MIGGMKKLMLFLLGLGLMVSPGGVKAQATEPGMMLGNVQSIVEALKLRQEATGGTKPMMAPVKNELTESQQKRVREIMEQIAKLQEELRKIVGNNGLGMGIGLPGVVPSGICRRFDSDLKVGDRGEKVRELKQSLREDLGIALSADLDDSDIFDAKLAEKVKLFQEKNAGEILKPVGLSKGSGYVGGGTRAVLNRRCAVVAPTPDPLPTNQAPISIITPNGNTTWELGEDEKITWASKDSAGDRVTIVLAGGQAGSERKTVVSSSTANDGLYEWRIPSSLSEGKYQIHVCGLNGRGCGTSDFFRLVRDDSGDDDNGHDDSNDDDDDDDSDDD